AAAAAAGAWQSPWRALVALGRELAAEWAAQDVRAALCQLLLLWLCLSLLGVRLAWRAYGGAVAALCYRTPPGARRCDTSEPGARGPQPRPAPAASHWPRRRRPLPEWPIRARRPLRHTHRR
ncbi:TCTA protein, partial [Rostratula benghalensis]|nr:TCTA protein [Rostratula benghalensis]